VAAVALQITALFRALRIEDDEVSEYRQTVRWFIASAVALLLGLGRHAGCSAGRSLKLPTFTTTLNLRRPPPPAL